jgi:hypothetical protein
VSVVTLVLLLCVLASSSSAQALTDAEIAAAIKAGASGQKKDIKALRDDCMATPGFGEAFSKNLAGGVQDIGAFTVTTSSTAGQIAGLAFDAKRLYETFSAASVPPELHTRALFVTATPNNPSSSSGTTAVAAPIEQVILQSKAHREIVLKPRLFSATPVEWSNLLGGKVTNNMASAQFDLDEVRGLPPGDIDIVLVTTAGERRCKLGTQDRLRLTK